MMTAIVTRGMTLVLLGLLVSGCAASRGSFGDDSCDSGKRTAVDGKAAYAIYVDKDGNLVGPPGVAEDLLGTSANSMCPTPPPEDEEEPGACPSGYCARVIGGKTYCLRCG